MKKTLIRVSPLIILAIVCVVCLTLVFTVKAQFNDKLEVLQNRVVSLETVTAPPIVNVLTKNISIGDFEVTNPKLVIEQIGLNTFVRAQITNKGTEARTYLISNRKADFTESSYKEIDDNSPYVVAPLTSLLAIDAGQSKEIIILVAKSGSGEYVNTEAWISVLQSSSQLQNEQILRILIKGNSG